MRPALLIASFVASLSTSLLLVACGSTAGSTAAGGPGAQTAGAGSGSDVECHDERATGSSIPRRVCRSKMQSDADRRGAEDLMLTPRVTPSGPGN
jgi:hypothetical protein